jgi:hypothetical protein
LKLCPQLISIPKLYELKYNYIAQSIDKHIGSLSTEIRGFPRPLEKIFEDPLEEKNTYLQFALNFDDPKDIKHANYPNIKICFIKTKSVKES